MRYALLWGVLVCGTACMFPGAEGPQNQEVLPAGKGALVLDWKIDPARALVGSPWAAAHADAFELLLVGGGVMRSVDLTGGTQVVSVDPGTWNLVVLAGVKRSAGSLTAYLVGSDWCDGVVVTVGQKTSVTLTLKSVDLGLASGGPAYWKSSVTMTATGKTRNPKVGMLLAGASTTSRPRLKSVELWNGYKEVSSVTGTPDDWVAEATGTVPDAATSFSVGLVGAGLCFLDSTSTWAPLAGSTKWAWAWPNRADLADTHVLAPLCETVVTASPPTTGLTVALGWE